MSHTNYSTCTSPFKVLNIETFIRSLHRANIRPVGECSGISANYFFDTNKKEFVISGSFDGNIGTINSETDEQRDRKLVDMIHTHADLTSGIDAIHIITNFTEMRCGLIINTGVWIDKIFKSKTSNKRYRKNIANQWTNN